MNEHDLVFIAVKDSPLHRLQSDLSIEIPRGVRTLSATGGFSLRLPSLARSMLLDVELNQNACEVRSDVRNTGVALHEHVSIAYYTANVLHIYPWTTKPMQYQYHENLPPRERTPRERITFDKLFVLQLICIALQ